MFRSPRKYNRKSRSRSRSRSASPRWRKDRSRDNSRDRSPLSSFSSFKPTTSAGQQYAALQKLKALYGATTSTKMNVRIFVSVPLLIILQTGTSTSKKDSSAGDTILLGSFSR